MLNDLTANNANAITTIFDRVIQILEQGRANAVQAINKQMIVTYWLIGKEIVNGIQEGEERAEYGKQVIENLSEQLTKRYGKGFSVTNLKYFRIFYLTYPNSFTSISHPSGDQFPQSFSPHLSWSHYRALMSVEDPEARQFYEKEAAECGWSKAQLERQIQTRYYERILANRGREGLLPANRERLSGESLEPIHLLKSPYILEFLDLPDSPVIHEKDLEQAIINNLQEFLLELGKGFSFVARQKHIRFDDDDFYIDLVFYNFLIKCFLLIHLKIGKLTHRDIGQMDGYVRLFEDKFKVQGDNPTIGLILCSDKSEAVAKYSVLSENKQIFAAKYIDILPTEQELGRAIQHERRLIEERLVLQDTLDK